MRACGVYKLVGSVTPSMCNQPNNITISNLPLVSKLQVPEGLVGVNESSMKKDNELVHVGKEEADWSQKTLQTLRPTPAT